jgi:LuxR family maltose regulon positive regulatory protein
MDAAAVLVTKIEPPRPRAGHVPRGRLLQRLAGADPPRLTLVIAPAGSGKSTLLAEWLAAGGGDTAFAWLGLDAGDNDPARFWTHLLASIARAGVDVPASLGDALAARGARAIEVVLPPLVNALAASGAKLVLVLDDYHEIAEPEIHEGVTFLLQHLPAGVRIAIASRSRPPIGVARLRAAGQLVDVTAESLRFSAEEAGSLLNGTLALDLPEADLDLLRLRTEGWAAGLYLAGLSLLEAGDRTAAIAAFSGSDKHIVDYLAEESLAGLDAETRGFLLETSILDGMTPALCDALRDAADSRTILDRLERSNLFLIPLDGGREWFRYHHLFQAVLQRQLALAAPPARLATLHARAAAWHAETGDTTAAVRHWLSAGEPARAAELAARDWNSYLQRGRVGTARGWLDALPEELVLADPQLSLARAWVLFDSGEFAHVERWTAAAEAADDGRALLEGGRSVAAAVTMLRATLAYVVGDLGLAARMAEEAVELEPDRESPWRAVALATFGSSTYWIGGDAERAVTALEEAVSLARPGVNSLATLRSLGMLAVVALELGRRDEAARWVERADEVRARESLEEYPTGVYGLAAKAQLLAASGDMAGALAASERAHVLGARSGVRPYLLYALTVLAGIVATARGAEAARELLREARAVAAACNDLGSLAIALDDAERRLRGRAEPGRAGRDDLSERELAVLRLLPTGLTFAEIGSELFVSKNTVRTHAQNIYRKLGVDSRADAVAAARRDRLL